MNILGIGIDIVENARIKKILVKNKSSFEKRVFTKTEISYCKSRNDIVNCYSKRFAAKEALSKAIGTGFRKGLNFKDITIVNDKLGKPEYEIRSNVKKLIYLKFKTRKIKISLSLADEKNYSIAFSVIHK